ncbi:MAG: patatin-like phospholipase family protein [Ferruginibacter sp.]|nr:patatin-like phospholipase family protein [Ferruginibacter sp.]
MRPLLKNIFYSFPVQLLILHFRKYQILLILWAVLVSAVNSGFMKSFGADSLFFVPEYMGQVDALSASLVGIAMGVFFMSWNITTFILHTKRFKFLATTSKPFLKYCMNNSILPLLFLLFYLVKAIQYNRNKELLNIPEQGILIIGFLGGLILLIAFSFAFFFGADRTILRTIAPVIANPDHFKKAYNPSLHSQPDGFGMKVSYFVTGRFKFKKARPVTHYSEQFLDTIFKRHHFAAMVGILLSFIFLITGGFFLDIKFFQTPAAASILIFFAIMVAVIGALTYFLQSWSVLFLIGLVMILNILYQNEIIDPRNKAYGLNYNNKKERPGYNKQSLQQLCTPALITRDKANMITILDNWKCRQPAEKPVIVFINVSGGGLRSATFTMNTLQQLDSITNGRLMRQTFLISGSSGGMLSATYFRELYAEKNKSPSIRMHDAAYINHITQDLLNPIFSSMISRDIFAPAQKFAIGPYQYVKDRGYAFEEKLNENSGGILNRQLKDYGVDEKAANIPMIIFNSVITRDGRKMMIGTQPLSFMMKPKSFSGDKNYTPDAVDFSALFARQNPGNIRLLTALRMNATFPYILPNVWLPSNPVIDVMDAGIRDNFGQETTLRFIDNFREWITSNTGGVVILQIRDRENDYWQHPLETGSITDIVIKPATMLQHNWHNFQDYTQSDQYSYLSDSAKYNLHRLTFIYVPKKEERGATLNFHLTAAEKKDVIASFNTKYNQQVLRDLLILTGN